MKSLLIKRDDTKNMNNIVDKMIAGSESFSDKRQVFINKAVDYRGF
jgi:hypothetical protein